MYPYLFNTDKRRRIASIVATKFERTKFSPIEGIQVQPLQLIHGGDYVAYGFDFHFLDVQKSLVYLSDFNKIPKETLQYVLDKKNVHVLVLDCLHESQEHFSHASLQESLSYAKKLASEGLNIEKLLLVGMACELEHEETNEKLKKVEQLADVSLAFDGLKLSF